MEGQANRPDAPAKPVRRSLKSIETNIVNRRTQMFETGAPAEPKSPKATPPQRPAPPKIPSRPNSNEFAKAPDVNAEIAKEFTQKVAQRKSGSAEDNTDSRKPELSKQADSNSPRKLPPKPRPPKPETKPRPVGVTIDKDKALHSSLQTEESTSPSSKEFPVPKPRPAKRDSTGHEEEAKAAPMYSVVDKSKKTAAKASDSDKQEVSQEPAEKVDSVNRPAKPPRTFEHDEYLKRKSMKRAMKHKSSHGALAKPGHDIRDGLREEPEDTGGGDTIFEHVRFSNRKSDSSQDGSDNHVYEEVGDPRHLYEEIGSGIKRNSGDGQKSDRPHPPPRPPNPKVITLSRSKPATPVKPISKTQVSDPSGTVSKKSVSNPGYEKQHEIIPIRTVLRRNKDDSSTLQRAHSDECLYDSTLNLKKSTCDSDDEPVYQDPVDVVRRPNRPQVHKGVVIDAEGYAVPHTGRHTLGRQFSNLGKKRARLTRTLATTSFRKRGPSVRNKVSEAYSILRRTQRNSDDDANQQRAESEEEEDEDSDVDMESHKKKLEHITSVKGKHYAGFNWTYARPVEARPRQLFDLGLIAGVAKDPATNKFKATVIFSFPPQGQHKPDAVAEFCFPDAASLRPVTRYGSETYSFILTSVDGTKHYGYCRRYLPPGSGNRLPEVCCVVSTFASFTFYRQLVEKMEKKRWESMENCKSLFKSGYGRPLPDPGKEAWIRCHSDDDSSMYETVIMKRPADCKLERVSFSKLTEHLSVEVLIKVFSAMVLERRLLFTAQYLSTLSNCIHAISALLYPFEWQHTYIPVLPRSMIEVVCAPTPFIIGLLSTSLPDIQNLPMSEVLIVDLDNNNLCRSEGDEAKILPKKLQKALADALKADPDMSGSKDTMIFEAFLRLFVETTGHYTEYICTQQDGRSVFEKELFCKAVSSKSIRMFLEWFTETQMFEEFITRKVETDKSHTTDTYDRRVIEYREEMQQAMETSLRKNVRQLGRRMINFVMESGGKIKKAFSTDSNVFV